MSDYKELVKELRDCRNKAVYSDFWWNITAEAADAIEELSHSLLMDAVPEWISVEERLPEDGIFVLVCNDDGHMMIAKHENEAIFQWEYKYTNYDWDAWDIYEQGPVCYWMPLPDPPKEGKP